MNVEFQQKQDDDMFKNQNVENLFWTDWIQFPLDLLYLL